MNFFLGCLGVIIGLGVFLTGVEISVSEIGSMMGEFLARFDRLIKVIVFGVFIGFTISIAEPDLLILAGEVTSAIGVSTKMLVMIISLCVGIMILPRGKGSKFMNLLNDFGAVAIGCFYGEGSASSEILNTLAIDKTKKEIVTALIYEKSVRSVIEKISEKLKAVNYAVDFSTSLEAENKMEYVCLYVIVDRHLGQKAIHIAQEHGARGATVIHGRGSGETVKSKLFLSMNIEPEKDLVIMLVKKDLAQKIRQEIYEQMDLENEGRGIIYSLPVDHVAGLVEKNN